MQTLYWNHALEYTHPKYTQLDSHQGKRQPFVIRWQPIHSNPRWTSDLRRTKTSFPHFLLLLSCDQCFCFLFCIMKLPDMHQKIWEHVPALFRGFQRTRWFKSKLSNLMLYRSSASWFFLPLLNQSSIRQQFPNLSDSETSTWAGIWRSSISPPRMSFPGWLSPPYPTLSTKAIQFDSDKTCKEFQWSDQPKFFRFNPACIHQSTLHLLGICEEEHLLLCLTINFQGWGLL